MRYSSVSSVFKVLEATKMGEWHLPFDRLASRLREILGIHHLDYVDLGKRRSFPLTLEVFALTDREITIILFRRFPGSTSLAVGNVNRDNQVLATSIWEEMRDHPLGPVSHG